MNTPTATPRTNAALEWVRPAGNDSGPPNEQYVSAEVARTLETELDAERERVRVLRETLDYVDRQVHDAWPKNASTYSETHRLWCIDTARAALAAAMKP